MPPAREDSWEEFAEGIRDLERMISQSEARTVRGPAARTAAHTLAQRFFREVRPHLVQVGMPEATVARLDAPLRELLQISNRNAPRSTYAAQLVELRSLYAEIAPLRETLIGTRSPGVAIVSLVERRIIDTLERLLPGAARSYQQAIIDLSAPTRLSYRGVAHELRETLRETLDHFAPDAEVMAEPRFQLEKGLTRPTQKQKALHVLRKRRVSKSARQAPTLAVTAIEELSASIARSAYTRGSASAHAPTSPTEVRQMKMYVDAVLAELLEVHQESQT